MCKGYIWWWDFRVQSHLWELKQCFRKLMLKKKKQQNKLVFSYSKISSFPGICLFKFNFYWTFVVVQSLRGVRLCNCMDCNTRGFPVFEYLPEFAQTHVHWVCDAIQPSHPLLPFSSCPQSFPASGTFPMSHLFLRGGLSIRASAQAGLFRVDFF